MIGNLPVNRGMAFLPFFPGELHIDVEIQFVFQGERVPVEGLHLDDVGVTE